MAAEPKLALVVARARNGVIGRDGALPWRLSSDLKRFKAITMGKPLLMGRKTFASIGRPLPGRPNLVLTRQTRTFLPGVWVFTTLPLLLAAGRAMAQAHGEDEICVIGGGELFAATLPLAQRIHLTEIEADLDGDAFMPPIDEAAFRQTHCERLPAGPKDEHATIYRVLERL